MNQSLRRPCSRRAPPIAGGAGIPLYLAGLLLIPEEGSGQSIAGSLPGFLRSRS